VKLKTILVIDDMKHIRDMLWLSLKQEGYKPVLAENGRKGLDYVLDPENTVDLLILDVMMPQMDGFQVLKELRSSNVPVSTTPVILLTAKGQKEDVLEGLSTGANDYILKPYKFTDLLTKVKSLIG
jgi:DNA-binding response OmpR family regulator